MSIVIGRCNLYEYCLKGNLVIKLEWGKVIIWYNYFINNEGIWIGGLDNVMYYGYCDVNKGEKWIVINWINIDGDGNNELWVWKKGSNFILYIKIGESENIFWMMWKKRESIWIDIIEEEMKDDMEDVKEWIFDDNCLKERYVFNVVIFFLEIFKEDEFCSVFKIVYEKLEMLCVFLVFN